MITNPLLKPFFILTFLSTLNSCKENPKNQIERVTNDEIEIFNFDNKQELMDYENLNLDTSHPNLLNPQISDSEYELVMNSWTDLHQRIGKHLSENDFNWGVKDSSITILHKIYFKSNGTINYYFFNVLNQNVTKEKKEQFSDLVCDFTARNKINLKKSKRYAQCGKTRYLNN